MERHVQRLVEGSLVGGPVSHEGRDDPLLSPHLEGKADARGEGKRRRPTMATAGTMPLDRSPMCMDPPLPLQQPVTLPNSSAMTLVSRPAPWRGQWPWGRWVDGDHVIRLERGAHPHPAGLLALVLVDGAGHDALEEQELHPLLELPEQHHRAVQAEEPFLLVHQSNSSVRTPARAHAKAPVSRISFTRARNCAAFFPLIRRWSTLRVSRASGTTLISCPAATGVGIAAPTASAAL